MEGMNEIQKGLERKNKEWTKQNLITLKKKRAGKRANEWINYRAKKKGWEKNFGGGGKRKEERNGGCGKMKMKKKRKEGASNRK